MPDAYGRDTNNDRGVVTVEAAIALGVIMAVLYLIIAGIIAVTDQLRCIDAAREAARLVARGEPDKAQTAAHRIAPANAAVHVSVDGDHIQVEISTPTLLPTLTISGTAFAVAEPQDTPL